MDKRINFDKYYLPTEVKDFELFIGPQGEYYKIKTICESDLDCTHYEWAKEYFNEYKIVKKIDKEEIFLLINYYGFIRYTHHHLYDMNPIIDFPNPICFGTNVTSKQKESLLKLLEYNKEYMTEQQKNELMGDSIDEDFIYDRKMLNFILKRGNYYEN